MDQPLVSSPVEIPPNALVLVTNATQAVPLEVIRQLLDRGCRVRASTPWRNDASWLDELFSAHIDGGRFERIVLAPGHPQHRGFYREAVRGVHAVVHSPTLPGLDNALEDVWSLTADSITSMLEAAEREPTVRALVYTSSLVAAAPLMTPADVAVTEDSWNIKDTMRAVTSRRGDHVVRNSAFVRAEQALWEWAAEQNPAFKINVISPSHIIGQKFGAEHTTDWRNWLWRLYRYGRASEVIPGAGPTQAHWYVDVEDVALLHVAAIFDPEISGCRVQAWGCFRDINDAIAVMQRVEKRGRQYEVVGDDGVKRGQLYTDFTRVSEIFSRWKGKGRWKEFEDTVAESLALFTKMGTPPPTSREPNNGAASGGVRGQASVGGSADKPKAGDAAEGAEVPRAGKGLVNGPKYLDISHRLEDLEDSDAHPPSPAT